MGSKAETRIRVATTKAISLFSPVKATKVF
jgi:hypothetical protein